MKLLREFTDMSEADRLSERLRAKGIMTHISSTNSKQLGAITTGAVKVGVWSVLNEQANDAIALLSNNKHSVENPLTEEQMQFLETESKMETATFVNGLIYKAVVALIAAFVVVALYSALSNS